MEKYEYREAVKADVKRYLEEEIDLSSYTDFDEAFDCILNCLWIADSVTGNGSGSYTFSTWKAEEYLCHNWDLLEEALDAFCDNPAKFLKSPEAADVTIRCYLLHEVLSEVLDELKAEGYLPSDWTE